jgi:hypothetical protein
VFEQRPTLALEPRPGGNVNNAKALVYGGATTRRGGLRLVRRDWPSKADIIPSDCVNVTVTARDLHCYSGCFQTREQTTISLHIPSLFVATCHFGSHG